MPSGPSTNEGLQKLCEEWKPRLGLEDWRIACEFRSTDELGDERANAQNEAHQETKTAVMFVAWPDSYNRHSMFVRHFPETVSVEWALVHEMLHVLLGVAFEDEPEDLMETLQEQAIETLTRSLLIAYGCISTLDE